MARVSILTIEDALLSALASLKTTHGVKLVGPYAGDLESPEKIASAVQTWPAVLVMFEDTAQEDLGQRQFDRLTFAVVVCDRSAGKPEESRRGGKANPGTYALLDAVHDLLDGKEIVSGDAVFPAFCLGVAREFQGAGVSVYSAMVEIKQGYLRP